MPRTGRYAPRVTAVERTDVIAAIAVLGDDATRHHLAAVADLDEGEVDAALDELVTAGVATTNGVTRLIDDMVRETVLAKFDGDRLARMHRQAAASLLDEGAADSVLAEHLRQVPPVFEPWALEVLLRAAYHYRRAGDPQRAAAVLRRALDERPPMSVRRDALVALARAEASFDTESAIFRYREVLPLLEATDARVQARLRLARCLATVGRVAEALEEARVALAEAQTDRDRLNAEVSFVAFARQTLDTRPLGRERLQRLSGEVDLSSWDPSSRAVLAELGYEQALLGTIDHTQVIATLVTALGGEPLEGVYDLAAPTRYVALLSLCWCGELRIAERAASLIIARGRRLGIAVDVAIAHAVLLNVAWRRGRLADTVACADEVFRVGRGALTAILPAIRAYKAWALAYLGRIDDAYAMLELPGGDEPWAGLASYHGYLLGQAGVHLAAGDDEAAYRSAQRCGTLARVMGTTNPAVLPWRSLAAEAAANLGREEAAALADEELALARIFGAPHSLALALRAAARTRAPGDAAPLLDEAARLSAMTPHRLLQALVQVDLARVLLATGGRGRAKEAAQFAMAAAQDVGAAPIVAEVKALLTTLGDAAPRPSLRATSPIEVAIKRAANEIRVLGGFTVVDANGREVTPRGVPAKAVRILVGTGHALHSEELADRLWDEPLSPEQVRSRLPNVINRARTPTGPLLVRYRDLVSLEPTVAVDADRFEEAVAAAHANRDSPDAIDTAMTASLLYGGDLLPTDPYADWAAVRREYLRQRYLAVTDLAVRLTAHAGLNELALDLLEAAIRHDPYDLDRYGRAATLLDAMGRHGAALAMRRRCEVAQHALGI